MAAVNDMEDLCAELTCPICLDYFHNPVTISECGHNFCQDCLTQCCGDLERETPCPQCRIPFQQKGLIANRQLASVVEIAKNLQKGKSREGEWRICGKHQEPLKLFCREDALPICVVCDKSEEHRAHEVIPLEEARQDYKEKTTSYFNNLMKLQAEICICIAEAYNESEDLLKQTQADREKTVFEFRQLHKFLEEQEKFLLAQMEEVEKEIERKRREYVVKLSKELSSLQSLILEVEKKCLQPASEFLQDIKSTLQRCEAKKEFKIPVVFPVALKWRIWDLWDLSPFLENVMKQLKDKLLSGLTLQKANVTLDPETAHPQLILSEDHKSMRMGSKCQDLPPNPKRFEHYFFVLGHEEFTTGRYFWEVTVERSDDWAVGVARKSVQRKGRFKCGPGEGFWALGNWNGEDISPDFTYVTEDIRAIRVSLNCPGGRVAFYNAETGDQLSVISEATLSGETIHPFFYLGRKGKSSCLAPFSGYLQPCLSLAPQDS